MNIHYLEISIITLILHFYFKKPVINPRLHRWNGGLLLLNVYINFNYTFYILLLHNHQLYAHNYIYIYIYTYYKCHIRFIITKPEGEMIISLILHKWTCYNYYISRTSKTPINNRACIINCSEHIIVMS